MARLHVLLCLTIITTSAYKHNYRYDYIEAYTQTSYQPYYQKPARYEEPERDLNERSINGYDSSQQTHASSRSELSGRSGNVTSKILNKHYPVISSRRGEFDDRVIFPGPTSKSGTKRNQFLPEVPESCKKIGICTDIPNYPEDYVNKIVSELGDKKHIFTYDQLDIPDIPDIAQRTGSPEEDLELCSFKKEVTEPRAAPDPNGVWYTVVNPKANGVQAYTVEICHADRSSCGAFVFFQDGYEGRCIQKYILRTMQVLDESGKMVEKAMRVPSCCSCVAKLQSRNDH